jgi:hypothetical protein
MKISNEGFLQKIWERQLLKLSSNVLSKYVGGKFSVTATDDFENSSSLSTAERQCITDKLGKQQILKRIRELANSGHIKFIYRDFTFAIISEQANQAFEAARNFYLEHGIPPHGFDSEKQSMNCMKLDNHKELEIECLDMLHREFKSLNWSEFENLRYK